MYYFLIVNKKVDYVKKSNLQKINSINSTSIPADKYFSKKTNTV